MLSRRALLTRRPFFVAAATSASRSGLASALSGSFPSTNGPHTPSVVAIKPISSFGPVISTASASTQLPTTPAGQRRGDEGLGIRAMSSAAPKFGGLGNADPCLVLGVTRDASLDQIKVAYRNKARRMHPDINPAPDAKEKFAQLNASNECLTQDWESGEAWADFAKKHKFRARPVPKLVRESIARAIEERDKKIRQTESNE